MIRAGDQVKTTRVTPLSLSDRLSGTGVHSGKRGVVVGTDGNRVRVTFEGRRGRTGWVSGRNLGVVRRAEADAGSPSAVRAALVLFMAWPVIGYLARYLWENGSFTGLGHALPTALGGSMSSWADMIAVDPAKTLVHMLFLAVVAALAQR